MNTAKNIAVLALTVFLAVWFLTESTINVIALGHYFGWW